MAIDLEQLVSSSRAGFTRMGVECRRLHERIDEHILEFGRFTDKFIINGDSITVAGANMGMEGYIDSNTSTTVAPITIAVKGRQLVPTQAALAVELESFTM